MIIEAEIGGHCVHRMYVDGGSASEILYEHCFSRLRPEIKRQLIPATTPLIGFSGEIIWPIGQIQLLVTIGDEEHSASALMNFVVVRSPSPYNGIIGRPGVRKLQAVPSTVHGMLKIPVDGGVITLKSSRLVPLECAMVSGPERTLPANETKVEERIKVAINPEYPEQTIMIGSTLTEEGRNKLCSLLQQNLDVFAWKPADMTGVPRHIAEHRLNVRKGCSPVRQKKRGQAADRNQAIQEEVGKLVEAGIMREVHYHDWLSNPVMVRKHDNSWRMCVDFKDLNKACPKDGYPLPEIDWKVESLCGFPFKCFLDAYKGYHQIQMAKEDEEKTAFITNQGIFCYTKMPFGLRNAGATYQRLVDKAFHKQIGRNLEVYVDDLVIKSRTEDEIVRDMEETFQTLREINMKLNPKKCTFGIEEGIFLGYKVSTRGLKVCPDKVDAVLSLSSPKCLKDVQKLNGKLASLNRFLAKSAEKSLPFFKTLKKCTRKSDFYWTTEAEEAFKQMKQLIAELPMLVAPMEKEELIVYLAAAKETVSAVLMMEREAKQMPVYFVSRALRGPEVNYTSMEKLVLALVHASKRLKRTQSIGQRVDIGRLYSRTTKRGIFGYSNGRRGGTPTTSMDTCLRRDHLHTTAEYEALIAGLKIAEQMGVKNLKANVDSRLVANQVNGTYVAKENDMVRYLDKHPCVGPLQANYARKLIRACQDCQVHKPVPRSPQQKLSPITSPWPFYKWGIDIAGPFPEGPGKVKFLIVAIDYFTKWIEAKPMATITGNQIKKFMWDNIICRFGLPGEIISDNGKQFQDNPFKDWCEKLCIRQHFASIKHPQTNGLVERANRSLGEGIKARLDKRSKKWMEELIHVRWAHRTMIKSSNGDTPFSLTYGTEAVIPAEIGMPTLRTAEVDLVQNDEALEISLNLLEERREQAAIREAKKQSKDGKVLQLQSSQYKL
ncbi:reverse transcriptase domain-containing protein [Tanacetum coccineum]